MFCAAFKFSLQDATVCDLYGKVRERFPRLSEKRFRLCNGLKEISPDDSNCQLDDERYDLKNNANIYVTFPAHGGV